MLETPPIRRIVSNSERWLCWCSICKSEIERIGAERSAAYDRMVAERNRAAASRRGQQKDEKPILPGQLELLKTSG
jgi:hypothetical protein